MSATTIEDVSSTDALRLPESCTGRLGYAQRTAPTGERAYGHFIIEAQALADVIGQQIDSPLLEEPGPDDLALRRWLMNPERLDDQLEMLPPHSGGLDQTVGRLFEQGRARAFCLCCNRNVARHEVRRAGADRFSAGRVGRYLCPEGHLLLGLEEGSALFGGSNRHAA